MPLGLCVFLGSIAAAALWLSIPACAEPGDEPLKLADSQLEPVKWDDVDGWAADDHLAAFAAFQVSCQPFATPSALTTTGRSTTRSGRSAAARLRRGQATRKLRAASSRTIFARC